MGLGPHWYQLGSKTCYILKVRKLYVRKGHLFITCKRLFYRPEYDAKGRPHGVEF